MQRQALLARRSAADPGDRGLSLLEVMFTIVVLAIAVLSTALLLVPVAHQANLRREVQVANLSAKTAMWPRRGAVIITEDEPLV